MDKKNTIEEDLEMVKENGRDLKRVYQQTFEICKAAVLAEGDNDVLCFVDPELRTTELLEAVGIDTSDYDDDSFKNTDDKDFYENTDSEDEVAVYIYGKYDSEHLEAAQRQLRRCLDGFKDSWEDVWLRNPLDAGGYWVKFTPDKSHFQMCFNFHDNFGSYGDLDDNVLTQLVGHINDFYDNESVFSFDLKLFVYAEFRHDHADICEHFVFGPDLDDGDWFKETEHKKWIYSRGGNNDNVLYDVRVRCIEKRCELWLAEDTDNKALIEKLKEELRALEKNAEKVEDEV
jgi:hypothetical protein